DERDHALRVGVALEEERREAEDDVEADDEHGAVREHARAEDCAMLGRSPADALGGATRASDEDSEGVLFDVVAHRGTSSATVVPAPGAEKSRALPPTSRRRATTDSAKPSLCSS